MYRPFFVVLFVSFVVGSGNIYSQQGSYPKSIIFDGQELSVSLRHVRSVCKNVLRAKSITKSPLTLEQVKELAEIYGLMEPPKINAHLKFSGGDISYWFEQKLSGKRINNEFAARKTAIIAATEHNVPIKDQGTLSWVANKLKSSIQEETDRILSRAESDKKIRDKYAKFGAKAVEDEIKHIREVTRVGANSIGRDGEFMVSTDLIQLRQISDEVKARIEGRKKAIKNIIGAAARDIENERRTRITLNENGRFSHTVERLDDAIYENNISMRSLSVAINMIVELSKGLYEEAQTEVDRDRKYDLSVEYTAFVYELSSIVIEILENFESNGVTELNQLFSEQKNAHDRIRGRIKNFESRDKKLLSKGVITKEELQQNKKRFSDYIAALDVVMTEWGNIMSLLEEQNNWVTSLKGKTERLRKQRDDAGLQLEILSVLRNTMGVLEYLQGVEAVIDIAELPLLEIDAELAYQLLGLESLTIEGQERRRLR